MAVSKESVAPRIVVILINRPTRSFELFGGVCSIAHLPEKKQPQAASRQDHNARVEDCQMSDFGLQPILQEEISRHERQDYRRNNADHPSWEKTAEHVDRGRSVAACAGETGCEQGQGFLGLLHFVSSCCGDDVAGGRLRRRFPVTNSRSTALRNSSEREATLDRRACANWRWAVTTSTKVRTPYL